MALPHHRNCWIMHLYSALHWIKTQNILWKQRKAPLSQNIF